MGMTVVSPSTWDRTKVLFGCALALAPEARPAFLDGACADDLALRDAVGRLLDADAAVDAHPPAALREPPGAFILLVRRAAEQARAEADDYGFAGPLSTSSHDDRSSTHT